MFPVDGRRSFKGGYKNGASVLKRTFNENLGE